MKTKILLYIICANIIIIVNSCKKYDDGPVISLRSKQHRVEGDWNVKIFTANGQNLLNYNETTTGSCQSGGTYYMTSKGTQSIIWTFEKKDWYYRGNYTSEYTTSGCKL